MLGMNSTEGLPGLLACTRSEAQGVLVFFKGGLGRQDD